MMMTFKLMIVIVVILIKQILGNGDGCIQSDETVKLVERCPQTQQAWEEAAVRKNCGGIPNSCSSFAYHCVMNTWRNETLEVCAPKRLIVGKSCAEYNFLGYKVQRNSKVNCTECPNVYSSTKSYQYAECYQQVSPPDQLPKVTTSSILLHNDETTTIRNVASKSSVTQGGSTTENQHTNGDIRIIIPISVAGGLVMFIIAIILIILCRNKKHVDRYKSTLDEDEELKKRMAIPPVFRNSDENTYRFKEEWDTSIISK